MKRQFVVLCKHSVQLILVSALVVVMLLTLSPQTLKHVLNPVYAKAAAANAIQDENSLPGDPTWNDFNAPAQPDVLSGYGSKISVNHGDSIDFFVTTTAASFTIDIYRTGYYGGAGARKVTSLGSFTGVHQAIPNPDTVTGMVACNWTKATTLTIPSTWVSGVYLARLNGSDGNKSFIFFVVRNDGGTEDVLFQASVTTYQAYNTWGGPSLYNVDPQGIFKGKHATKASFDRPFNPGDSNGAGHYLFYEYKMVYWLEKQGYNVSYITDVDTDTNVNHLTNHKAFLSVGHDEYWSKGMRDNLQAAINAGVNVAFFSANAMYWQIRFEPNAAGVPDRVEVGYKDFATDTTPPGPDPQWHVNNAIVTTDWRGDPVNNPENGVIGIMYEDQNAGGNYPYVVQNASNWVYAGSGFVNGTSVPGIVGYEYDKVFNNGATPAGLTVLSNSPVVGSEVQNSIANSSLYTAASGARVFAGGTIVWSWGLANIQGNTAANAGIQQTTTNILNNFINCKGPCAGLNPTSLSFGKQILGTSSSAQTVTLTNSGSAALSFSNIAIAATNASEFSQTNNCPTGSNTLAPAAACTIHVTFSPTTTTGARTASLTFTDNATDSPQSVALTGIGATAASGVALSPTSLNFNNQNVGSNSTTQNVTLNNSGTTPLSISNIGFTGTNRTDFSQTNDCPSGSNTLAADSSCTITVTFTPGATGARSANLTLTDNAADSPQSVALVGNGVTATVFFNEGFESGDLSTWTLPSSDSTGSADVESSLINTGSQALAFDNSSGQYAYIYTALPSGPEAQAFTRFYFRVASNVTAGAQLAIGRSNSGSNTFEIDYNANRHGVDVYVWDGSGKTYSIFSPNNVLSANTWYSVELQDYQLSNGHAQAWLNGNSIGSVDADLSNANPYARLMLYDSAPGTMYVDNVVVSNIYNGTISPAPGVDLSATSLSFGKHIVGNTSSAQTITLTNSGSVPLSISSIALNGTNAADYAQTNNCPSGSNTLAVGSSCNVNVTFTPRAIGASSANLTLTDNATDSPQSVALSGTGAIAAPVVSLSPTSLNFGYGILGTTSPAKTVTLTNTGTTPLSISSIAITGANAGDYASSNTCPSGSNTLAVDSSCTISVTFTPGANGARSANLTLTDTAADSPQSVGLGGTGMTATTYFQDNFESGNLSAWTLPSADSTGTASAQSTVVNSGSNALSFNNSSGQYVYLNTALPSGPVVQTYTRFAFRFSSNVTGGTELVVGRNGNGNNVFEVDFDYNRHGLDIYFWNSSGGVYSIFSPNNALSPDTWYSIEVQDYQISNGHAQVWINGSSIGSVDADLSSANPYAGLMLFDSAPGTIYIDDVKVSNV